MKEFEELTTEDKKSLMAEFLSDEAHEGVTFQQWYELEYGAMSCFNGK